MIGAELRFMRAKPYPFARTERSLLHRCYALRMPNQRYRFRTPSSGREVIIDATPGSSYTDPQTGETLKPVGVVLPLAPSESRLPWSVENLRLCNHCGQMAQRDLNTCPTCERRMGGEAS